MRRYAICVGSPYEGLTLYGPFDDFDDALEWAERARFDRWEIVEIENPD